MPDYKEVIAGTDIDKNPELPAPKKIVGSGSSDIESGQVEVPLAGGFGAPPPSLPKKIIIPKIKRSLTIRESDNGYIMDVFAGDFHEEWVFTKLSRVIKTVAGFFKATIDKEE